MEQANQMISVSRQCDLLGLNRSSYYYRSERDDSYNEYLMRLIDEQYTFLWGGKDDGLASSSGTLGE